MRISSTETQNIKIYNFLEIFPYHFIKAQPPHGTNTWKITFQMACHITPIEYM